MTGICGWHEPGRLRDEPERLGQRMAARLGRSGPVNMCITSGGLIAAIESTSSVADEAHGRCSVAIAGHPRWLSEDLASRASELGDAKALQESYRRSGIDLFNSLAGDFALVIVDKHSSQVIIAVDRMGIQPMCYARLGDKGLIFGQNTRSITEHNGISPEISALSIYSYIYFHVIPSPDTIFSEIRKLEPGQFARLTPTSFEIKRYWYPQALSDTKSSEQDLQQRLKVELKRSVHRALEGVNAGAFLSGGLDSSTICGLANDFLEQPLKAYSIGFGQDGYDETAYARIAADHFGFSLTEYYVTENDIVSAIPVIANEYDEPFGNSSAVPAYFCAKLANVDGVTCLLAGDGGDELFAGNERYATQSLYALYDRIPRFIRGRIIEPAVSAFPSEISKFTHKVSRYIDQARVPMPERMQTYNYLHMNAPETVFSAEFLLKADIEKPIRDMATWYRDRQSANLIDSMLFFDWKLTLADNDIRKVNRMCAVAPVDVRYPFLDDDVVAFSLEVPANLKLRNRQLRYFFKRSMQDYLPKEIINKSKHGFGLPFGEWLKSNAALRDVVMPLLRSLDTRNVFAPGFIGGLTRRHQEEHAAYYGNLIWVLIMLESWLQTHAPNYRH